MLQRRRPIPVSEARARASFEAVRAHERLGTDLSRRIDIFGIIKREGIWLMFQPVKSLYGLYRREGEVPGILINSWHPPSLQRFTAAHEYGHHVLGHDASVDDAEEILSMGRISNPDEAAAQTFAAHFLMPLQLVNFTLRRMGLPINPTELTAQQVYRLSLEIGASYAAAVTQLQTLKKITAVAAEELRRQQPKGIKAGIGRGVGPENPWSDLWPLAAEDTGRQLSVRTNDELSISLPEVASTGFIWTIDMPGVVDLRSQTEASQREVGAEADLALVVDELERRSEPGEGMLIGGGGTRHIVFRALRPGRCSLRLVKRRPWKRSVDPADIFELHLDIAAKPTGGSDSGLIESQKPLVAVAA